MLAGVVGLDCAQRRIVDRAVRYAPIYFAALGDGFIAIEISLIQQTRLFLGHLTLAVTTILGLFLIGGGVGSDIAGGWPDATKSKRLFGTITLIVAIVLLWLLIWPWLNQTFLGLQTLGRGLIAVASLLPLALLMGIPVPLGLWFVGHAVDVDRNVALGWAVNGIMTVVGSVLAVAMAILIGFSSVLLVGAGAYTIAATFLALTSRGR